MPWKFLACFLAYFFVFVSLFIAGLGREGKEEEGKGKTRTDSIRMPMRVCIDLRIYGLNATLKRALVMVDMGAEGGA